MRAVDRADGVSDYLAVGYARCSTDEQDLTAQRDALARLGVPPARVYVDHGRTGTNRDRPGLRQAFAAVRSGDTLVVTKLDRLARSVPDARRAGSGRHHHPSPAHHLGTGNRRRRRTNRHRGTDPAHRGRRPHRDDTDALGRLSGRDRRDDLDRGQHVHATPAQLAAMSDGRTGTVRPVQGRPADSNRPVHAAVPVQAWIRSFVGVVRVLTFVLVSGLGASAESGHVCLPALYQSGTLLSR